MSLAQETNRYLDEKSPWKTIKEDRQAAATSLYVAICVISYLKTMLYPFLPFSSQKLHEYLGFKGKVEDDGWQATIYRHRGKAYLRPSPCLPNWMRSWLKKRPGGWGSHDWREELLTVSQIYEPVQEDLARVEDQLRSVSRG